MFRKYEKTFRVNTPENKPGKLTLSAKDSKALLIGRVEITEKIDGANVGIVRSKNGWTLQKRRGLADEGVHAQFSFFWNWARHNEEKILKIPKKWIVYGELTYARHHIFYDMLSSYFIVFDIWDGRRYIKHDERIEITKELDFQHVPVLHYGYIDFNELIGMWDGLTKTSAYVSNGTAEGIVIKNLRKQMRGKVVRPEFVKALDDEDHWMKGPMKRNKLRPNANVYD